MFISSQLKPFYVCRLYVWKLVMTWIVTSQYLWKTPDTTEWVEHEVLLQGEHDGHVTFSANQILFY
jgi:hypothetical protein